MKCLYCKTSGENESPFMDNISRVINPRTFRYACLCGYCYEIELDDLKDKPSKNVIYENMYDEYMAKFA